MRSKIIMTAIFSLFFVSLLLTMTSDTTSTDEKVRDNLQRIFTKLNLTDNDFRIENDTDVPLKVNMNKLLEQESRVHRRNKTFLGLNTEWGKKRAALALAMAQKKEDSMKLLNQTKREESHSTNKPVKSEVNKSVLSPKEDKIIKEQVKILDVQIAPKLPGMKKIDIQKLKKDLQNMKRANVVVSEARMDPVGLETATEANNDEDYDRNHVIKSIDDQDFVKQEEAFDNVGSRKEKERLEQTKAQQKDKVVTESMFANKIQETKAETKKIAEPQGVITNKKTEKKIVVTKKQEGVDDAYDNEYEESDSQSEDWVGKKDEDEYLDESDVNGNDDVDEDDDVLQDSYVDESLIEEVHKEKTHVDEKGRTLPLEMYNMAPAVFDSVPTKFVKSLKNPCWKGADKKPRCLPYFYLLGMPESEDNDVWLKIVNHPNVVKTKKDLDWWSYGRIYNSKMTMAESFDAYLSNGQKVIDQIKEGHKDVVYGDGTQSLFYENFDWELNNPTNKEGPTYTLSRVLHQIQPDAKLIVIFDDPTKMVFKDYASNVKDGEAKKFHQWAEKSINIFNACVSQRSIRACVYRTYDPSKQWDSVSLHFGFLPIFLEDWDAAYPVDQMAILNTNVWKEKCDVVLPWLYSFLKLDPLDKTSIKKICDLEPDRPEPYNPKLRMFKKTKKMLDDFFKPFNEKLNKMINE